VSQINDTRMLEMMRGTPPPSWEQTCLKLSEEKRELQERIKRLEEAGDAMERWCSDYQTAFNWEKAKEAKP
jgi:DNA repair exonuclease SbcCD ATPase subunit